MGLDGPAGIRAGKGPIPPWCGFNQTTELSCLGTHGGQGLPATRASLYTAPAQLVELIERLSSGQSCAGSESITLSRDHGAGAEPEWKGEL